MLSALGRTCEEMQQLAATFHRLSLKKDKKASTRASAAQQSAYWTKEGQACLAARAVPIPPVVQPPIGQPPYQPPYIPPWGGGGGGGPMYPVGAESGPVFTPIDEIFGTGAMDDMVLSQATGVPLPPGVAPMRVAPISAPSGADECSFAGKLPLQYADEFGPMTVVQIVCSGEAAAQPDEGGGAFGAEVGPTGPIEQSEIAAMDSQMEGLSGLDYLGIARHLG